ncbi:uncharacterized protein LAJ45_11193 [Morchella importuna]|uniref:uncharacterized protein n=1 Tax=Morchella importuna TaxID=1174673 RepID=UPI001E8DA45D|nr:uncharacterized protein LAJ45_11212 [Morchella importuna]XP_045966101.1 uncharacterized protein LAJ45_11193 [Morchella importuna]KAH8144777.1 hypothetical protein LAJ45_11212 [Morchella importuna]KAH8144797.1 hypothetical protein LAJ45_11193 [Morchella importuna]
MDLNYISWVIRNALTVALEPLNKGTEQTNKNLKATIEVLSVQNESLKHTVDTLAKQMFEMTKNQDKTSDKLHRLQHQLTNLSINRHNNQMAAEGRTATTTTTAAVTAATIPAPPPAPTNNSNHAQQQPKGKGKETPIPQAPKSYASIAAGNANPEYTTVTNRRKPKPKVDPLFKPEVTKINREIVIETNKESPVTPCNGGALRGRDRDFDQVDRQKGIRQAILSARSMER